jgi:DNA-binding HxlR family transcriptional regulator
MALPREYVGQNCSIARALEIVGERWTLLIVRDAFYGVRRFSDFCDHLDIPRAVLTDRLNLLVEHGILDRCAAPSGRDEYALTAKGLGLWPTIWALACWGNEHYVADPDRGVFSHAGCGRVGDDGVCESCGARPGPADLTVHLRRRATSRTDPISQALYAPHRLLTPLVGTAS